LSQNKPGTYSRPVGVWLDKTPDTLDPRDHAAPPDGSYALTDRPLAGKAELVNESTLYVAFNQAVSLGDSFEVKLAGNAVTGHKLDVNGKWIVLRLDEPVQDKMKLVLQGLSPRQAENRQMKPFELTLSRPDWPSDYEGLRFKWTDAHSLNVVPDTLAAEGSLDVRRARLQYEGPLGSIDEQGELELSGYGIRTNFTGSIYPEHHVFHEALANNTLTIEAVVQPASLNQGNSTELPARIMNFGAHRPSNWSFTLGQHADKLVFGIRTDENFLNQDGKPLNDPILANRTRYGRGPTYAIGTLTVQQPQHAAIVFDRERILGYIDGEKVFERDEPGKLSWKYTVLTLGGYHALSGTGDNWKGTLSHIGIY